LHQLPERLVSALPPRDHEDWQQLAAEAVEAWSIDVVDALVGQCAAIKPQVAFFEALGAPGVAALSSAVSAARDAGLVVILDAKRGDIGSTAEAYALATLDEHGMNAHAVTVSPYLGPESLAPFLRRCPSRGVCVLVRTSNSGSAAWQLGGTDPIAARVADWVEVYASDTQGAVGAVIGATLQPHEVRQWRARMPSAWFLVPGYGAQGATAHDVLAHFRPDRTGALVVSASGVLFGDTPRAHPNWKSEVNRRAKEFAADLIRVGLG